MPGGLMNLIAYGNQNIILNGNPTKSFFKTTYMKYTNFGLQKFRIEHDGLRQLDLIKETHYTFKMPRYGDLLMDTYLVVKLPHIWSPLYRKSVVVEEEGEQVEKFTFIPYEFKWTPDLGTHMIKEIRIRCGNTTLQHYSGEYISICAKRDYSRAKLNAFNAMTGNTADLNKPEFPFLNFETVYLPEPVGYPSAFFDKTSLQGGGPEPSIRGRRLYIPLNTWFCNNSKQPFPMVASQYSELFIDITLRPLKELFVIRDVSSYYNGSQDRLSYNIYNNVFTDETKEYITGQEPPQPDQIRPPVSPPADPMPREDPPLPIPPPRPPPAPFSPFFVTDYPHIAPNFNLNEHAMYRFLHPPPNPLFDYSNADKRVQFNTDIHLISTYGFLSEEENRELSQKEQSYLIKDVHEYTFRDVVGTQKIQLDSTGLISNWTFFMRRSDVDIRNEWSNYSNWTYNNIKPQRALDGNTITTLYIQDGQLYDPAIIGNNVFTLNDPNFFDPNFIAPPIEYFASGPFNIQNEKNIIKRLEILLDGKLRETRFDSGVFQYIEPFMRTSGGFTDGLHVYNFGLKTDPFSIQPNGAINLSKFSKIELEIETELPPLDPDAEFNVVCANLDNTAENDAANINNGAQIIGVNKETFRLYKYTYDLRLFEEKYNVVNFVAGNCGLMFSR